jgi:hypothetical protein
MSSDQILAQKYYMYSNWLHKQDIRQLVLECRKLGYNSQNAGKTLVLFLKNLFVVSATSELSSSEC